MLAKKHKNKLQVQKSCMYTVALYYKKLRVDK